MSGFEAIYDVSETLKDLLENKFNPTHPPPPPDSTTPTPVDITLASPDETIQGQDGHRINIYLYQISENVHLKNYPWVMNRSDPTRRKYPPLSLTLSYLLTPYPKEPAKEPEQAHKILGQAMQIFYENAIVPKESLHGNLRNSAEEIKLFLKPLSIEDISKIWTAFTKPFRLSVCYEVSVVQIDSLLEMPSPGGRVEKAQILVNPYKSSSVVISSLMPEKGPPGTVLSIYGKGFKPFDIKVQLDSLNVSKVTVLSDSQLNCVIPDGLPPGSKHLKIVADNQESNKRVFTVTASQ